MTGTETLTRPDAAQKIEHFDVLIAGAGISGVGAAYHIATQTPDKSFVVLEGLESFGGTWHMHRYPGIRSDSDLYTFGYRFKPWLGEPIAKAEKILAYMGEVIEENDLARHIRYQHKILSARWSSKEKLWTVEALRKDTGETVRFSTSGREWRASRGGSCIRRPGLKISPIRAKKSS
jgi:cation diffusion facilitator CzcD-associated flavoprotein CzcO